MFCSRSYSWNQEEEEEESVCYLIDYQCLNDTLDSLITDAVGSKIEGDECLCAFERNLVALS